MQKLINTLAVLSFGVSAAVVGGGVFIYHQREAIQDNIRARIVAGVEDAVESALGGSIDEAVPLPAPETSPMPIEVPGL